MLLGTISNLCGESSIASAAARTVLWPNKSRAEAFARRASRLRQTCVVAGQNPRVTY